MKNEGIIQSWQIKKDVKPQEWAGIHAYYKYCPEKSGEISVNQPFCKNVVTEINDFINLCQPGNDLIVVGDNGGRKKDQVYPDIIIGPASFEPELIKNPPDLSKES